MAYTTGLIARWEYVKTNDGYSLWAFDGDWWLVIACSTLDYVEQRYSAEYGLILYDSPIAITRYQDAVISLEYCRDTSPDPLNKLLGSK